MDELIKLTETLGIELITIDLTIYICNAIPGCVELTALENKQFSFKHDGPIKFEGFGILNAVGDALVSRIEFNTGLEYFNGVEMVETKCIFDSQAVEKIINQIKK